MKPGIVHAILILAVATLPSRAGADIPCIAFSTCNIIINQSPQRPQCLAAQPPIARLCPDPETSPVFDTVTFDMVILDCLFNPVSGVTLSTYEMLGNVNIAEGASSTAITDGFGRGTIGLQGASGNGRVGVCADGVLICELDVRSPDVARSPTKCVLPTSTTSFVAAADILNPACGYLANFGPVTPGVNEGWDLNCDGAVNSVDVLGPKGGSVLPHFGHGGYLDAPTPCPLP